MKILWIHNFDLSEQNAGVFMLTTLEGLRELGVSIHLEYLGNLRSISKIMKAQNRLEKLAKNFDLVHVQYGSACALASVKITSCPKIVTLRGSDWNNVFTKKWSENIHSIISTRFTLWALKSFDYVITVSDRMTNDVRRKFPSTNIMSIPSPINLNLFKPIEKSVARNNLGFPGNTEKWILFTTNDIKNPLKRFDIAKKTIDLLNEKSQNFKLRIANGLKHSEIPLFVASCDLILCTSVSEGWPNSIKEALACNIPFVSTDVSDLKNISELEPSCRLCLPDATELAYNIQDVLQKEYVNNLRKYVEMMSMPNVSLQIFQLYEKLINESKS
jgi:teichuronic acid biosynthesis glycosyltransferase TuaC